MRTSISAVESSDFTKISKQGRDQGRGEYRALVARRRQHRLLATVGAKKQTGAVEAGARQVGEIGVEEDAQRIALAPAAGGVLRLVSPPDSYVYEYDWMPDGKGFVATSAKGNGDNNWWVATLGHVDLHSGALRIIARPSCKSACRTCRPMAAAWPSSAA
jgi:hypothetical protein